MQLLEVYFGDYSLQLIKQQAIKLLRRYTNITPSYSWLIYPKIA